MWASGFTTRAANSSAARRGVGDNAFGHVLEVFQSVVGLNQMAGLIPSFYWELWEKLSSETAEEGGLTLTTLTQNQIICNY